MITFHISDMTCGNCAGAIARAVASVDKDARVEVSIPQKLVSVQSVAQESALAEAIQKAGFTPDKLAVPASRPAPSAGGCCCGPRKSASAKAEQAAPPRQSSCCG